MSQSEQSWSAVTREELDALIEEGLAKADDEVRAAWERIRIPPEKWQCSPVGDLGGGFWAVAIDEGSVAWFNDIEGGFNESPFSSRGVIDDYQCSQSSFEDFLKGLPEALAAEGFAAKAPARAVPEELAGSGTVLRRQSTYWELRAAEGSRWRVHLSAVQERSFTQANYARAEVVDQHPLLWDFTEPWAALYISGAGAEPSVALATVEHRIATAAGGWRRLGHYRESMETKRLLQAGHGLLLRAPRSVVDAAAVALRECQIPFSILAERTSHVGDVRLLLLSPGSYIVARAFRFEPLPADRP